MAPPSRVAAAIQVAEREYSQGDTQVWCPHTESSLNAGGQNLNQWKLHSMLKVLYADFPSLSLAISVLFAHEIYILQSKIAKKIL